MSGHETNVDKLEKRSLYKIYIDEAKELLAEVKAIKSIDMTLKAKNIMEQVCWASLGIIGTIWIVYFISDVIQNNNPIIISKQDVKLADLNYPAITVCTDITTKYSMIERLGNYFDPMKTLPPKLNSLRRKMLDKALLNRSGKGMTYEIMCIGSSYLSKTIPKETRKIVCQAMEGLYHKYIKRENGTFEMTYEEFIDYIMNSTLSEWNLKNLVKLFMDAKWSNKTILPSITLANITEEEVIYLDKLANIYYLVLELTYSEGQKNWEKFDWATNNVGTFFVQNSYIGWQQNSRKRKGLLGVEELFDVFTLPGQNVSIPDIASMFNVKDFRQLHQTLYSPAKYSESEPCECEMYKLLCDCPTVQTIRESAFQLCIESFINKTDDVAENVRFFNKGASKKKETNFSPCQYLDVYPDCHDYCKWHSEFITKMDRKYFQHMMASSQPQRKLKLFSPIEEKIAGV